jgi:ankyrin repeat protein
MPLAVEEKKKLIQEAMKGSLDAVKLLVEDGMAVYPPAAAAPSRDEIFMADIFLEAARRGHIGILSYLLEKSFDINRINWLCFLTFFPVATVEFLVENGIDVKFPQKIIHQNVLFSQDHVLTYLHKQGLRHPGCCYGLSLLYSAYRLNGKSAEFFRLFSQIPGAVVDYLGSHSRSYAEADNDQVLQQFIAKVISLQHAGNLVNGSSLHYHGRFAKLFDENPELQITYAHEVCGIFSPAESEKILRDVIVDNSAIQVMFSDHVVSLGKKNGQYFFYDPNYKTGDVRFYSIDELVKWFNTEVSPKYNRAPDGLIFFAVRIFTKGNACDKMRRLQLSDYVVPEVTKERLAKYPYAAAFASVNYDPALENLRGDNNITRLHLAAEFDGADVISDFLQEGDDIDEQTKDGKTALDFAIENRSLAAQEALLAHYASINKPPKAKPENLELKKQLDSNNVTRLHWAAKLNQDLVVAEFLRAGDDFDAQTKDGKTALDFAIESGSIDAQNVLLERYGNATPKAKPENLVKILYEAVSHGKLFLVDILLDAKNINVKEHYSTLLCAALKTGKAEMVKFLLRRGAVVSWDDLSRTLHDDGPVKVECLQLILEANRNLVDCTINVLEKSARPDDAITAKLLRENFPQVAATIGLFGGAPKALSKELPVSASLCQ